MVNPKAFASLTDCLEAWIEKSSSEDWWTDVAGYMTEQTEERLALIVLLAMSEARHSTKYAEKERA